ncbi:embigin [Panthera pardus]|uniref:Embigin n=1 Tax=Panthera pardus TaxID=9691 RepID=A0A9W2VW55_PANPR|nr:embigin [Panthera pardus]
MRAPSGLLGPRGLLPLALLCLLAAARGSLADGQPTVSPLTSVPIEEERITKYSNLSLESHNIPPTVSPLTSVPIEEERITKYSNLSLESHNIPPTVSPLTSVPIEEERITKYSNLSLESHNIPPTASPLTSLPIRREMMTKYSNLSLESHNISLTEHSNVPVEKNITLERPSNIELTCQITISRGVNSVNVTWKKGDELLENYLTNATGCILYAQYMFTIINSKQMGSYSCFFGGEKEQRGTFNFKVPEIHGKNKPLITYVGDSTVLMCKCQHCSPLHWTWYHSNGSVQVPIDVQMSEKYAINRTNANETRLKIMQLTEDNQGSYWCHAVFQLGESEERVQLVVLSYLVPLKPFLGIVVEVAILVAVILLCETYTQKKKKHIDDGKEFEQVEQLKSDDTNGVENNAPRHRKNESVSH